jgi:hypothetical protein
MPTTITGTTITATAISGSTFSSTGGTQGFVTPTAGSAPYYGLRAWAAVSNASGTPTFVGYNISSIARVGTGLWDVTFATAGYTNVNSVSVISMVADTNYDIMFQYDKAASNTSKIRIRCVINTGNLYSPSSYSLMVAW